MGEADVCLVLSLSPLIVFGVSDRDFGLQFRARYSVVFYDRKPQISRPAPSRRTRSAFFHRIFWMKALIHVLRENQRRAWRRIRVRFADFRADVSLSVVRMPLFRRPQLGRYRLCGSYYPKIHRERRARGFVVFAKDEHKSSRYCNRDSGAGGLLNWGRISEGILRM